MQVTAAVIHETGDDYQLEEITLDEPKHGEVMIQIVASGICHTDVSAQNQLLPVPLPAVLGHEGAGVVVKTGAGVKGLEAGDHVILSYASCGHCEYCLTGNSYACEDILSANFAGKMLDNTHRLHQEDKDLSNFFGQSSFATYAVANARYVVKVDKEIDLRLLAPLGCGIQTGAGAVLNVFNPSPGSSIAIFGSGTVGMSALMAAKAAGCTTRIVVDLHDSRLALARELGATHTINSKNVNVVEEVKKISGKGVNYAIESTGVTEVLREAVLSLAPMGKAGIIGAPKMGSSVQLDVMDMLINVKEVVGIHQGSSIPKVFIPVLIDLYKKGELPFDKLIKFYDFAEINKAVSDSKSGATIKPVLTIS
jgi:aryl-alcohol dehydrogenase